MHSRIRAECILLFEQLFHAFTQKPPVKVFRKRQAAWYKQNIIKGPFSYKNMLFTEEKLSEFAEMNMKVCDRSELPFEEKFADTRHPYLTSREAELREKAVWDTVVELTGCEPSSEIMPLSSTAWLCYTGYRDTSGFKPPVEEKAGMSGVIFTNSPFLSDAEYAEVFTGLSPSVALGKSFDPIALLHEAHHPLFMPHRGVGDLDEVLYAEEARADFGGVKTYLEYDGFRNVAEDFAYARRTNCFLGNSALQYCTAGACEAAQRKNGFSFPSFSQASGPMQDLQLRVVYDLKGVVPPDDVTGSSRSTHRWVGDTLLWVEPYQIVKSLVNVMEKATLSEATAYEASMTLRAFNNFLPDEVRKATYRSCRAAYALG